MTYPFVLLLASYFSTLERLWYKKNIVLILIGILSASFVCGILFFFEFYEAELTNIMVQWLNNMLGIKVHDYASLNSFLFFLYLISSRICLFLFLVCCFYFLCVTFLMPFIYLCMLYTIRHVVGERHPYSWRSFAACYRLTYILFIGRGSWSLLYLLICLVFSFVPYVGIFLALISLFTTCHLMGGAYIALVNAIYQGKKINIDKQQWTVGFMLFFSMLCPVVGWALIPIWHVAALSRCQFNRATLRLVNGVDL